MKSFWKKHWKWLVPTLAAAVALISGVVFLYCKGFRIVYDPAIITNWDAVSACAAWGGVIMSFVAIIFAIWVPVRIAKRQDKIALFEKRIDVYKYLKICRSFKDHVNNQMDSNLIRIYFLTCFQHGKISSSEPQKVKDMCIGPLTAVTSTLETGYFLFDFDTKDVIDPLVKSLTMLIIADSSDKNYESTRTNYLEAVKKLDDQFMNKIEEELILRK